MKAAGWGLVFQEVWTFYVVEKWKPNLLSKINKWKGDKSQIMDLLMDHEKKFLLTEAFVLHMHVPIKPEWNQNVEFRCDCLMLPYFLKGSWHLGEAANLRY